MLTDLQGQIERITYTNEENGYTIARLKVYGHRDLVTVVGNLMAPNPGEILKMKGEWTSHPKYGEQFKIVYYDTAVPATVYGIRKYLGSGLIKGVGPIIAERIVNKFGEETLDIIEDDIGNLAKVEGIGKKRIAMIQKAWDDQKEIREVMVFLQSHGVSSGYATKIFKQYGNESVAVVRENPYRLAMDIFGIGFITADRIAEQLGFAKDSPLRAEAGVLYVLHQLSDEGHVYYPYEPLIEKSREILEVDREIVANALATGVVEKKIVIEDLNEDLEEFRINNKAIYLAKFHTCETGIARRLKLLVNAPKSVREVDSEKAAEWVQKQLAIQLAEKQAEAIQCAIESKVMVITGGPGTGKTTIINAILKIFSKLNVRIMLAAPTGRAAKRMTETTGYQAKTIHRMLEYSIAKGGFQKDHEKPLNCDLLIVDEASMIDTVLMHHLLKAIPPRATFILVGDVNQLPSVGAGNVLNDIIASDVAPVVELNEIFRQARESQIVMNAHKINNGRIPYFDPNLPRTDFYFIQKEDPEKVLDIIMRLVKERIPGRFGFDPVDDIQVLTPMHKGIVGAANLNMQLQRTLNPGENGVVRGDRNYRVNDKVMQIRNNYDKEVFNGDIGRIIRIDSEEKEVIIVFDRREVTYDFTDLDEIVLAYAVSVHKSQGSEYPAVVIPILTQHFILLQRNLIYTAVTRGRELVVMVGTKKALAIGVKNNKTQKRFTYLKHRLR
ncbi:SF1B family DNA helicase RecD2 [Desulfonema magnum]|uniref:ATP-dependent DNA helicase RecD domain-containing protein n=1 Tax=Desulfonema magnum TaxID=45655 RepID=A0A975BPG6_9BACT|nr:ATP-dependent RecD-like DNA helicase [Desulfonema magnum]QTA88953.1 ATP-dependent DNA helicase RecD domain-containing protein [Desulfonema magnum]